LKAGVMKFVEREGESLERERGEVKSSTFTFMLARGQKGWG